MTFPDQTGDEYHVHLSLGGASIVIGRFASHTAAEAFAEKQKYDYIDDPMGKNGMFVFTVPVIVDVGGGDV